MNGKESYMRLLTLSVFVCALAVPAMADDTKKPACFGEEFVINGKYICAEDPGIRNHTPGTPMPVARERVPHLKLGGSLLVNGMMAEEFHADRFNYTGRTGKYGWPRMDSAASLQRERTGWGLSAQWSADGVWWVEGSWERPERVNIGIDTTRVTGEYSWWCVGASTCPARIAAHQTNLHQFTADDFTLGILYDLNASEHSKFISVLLGGGIHRRYIRDQYAISTHSGTELYRGDELAGINDRNDTDSAGTTKATQTRIFGQLDLELYPAGKNRWVGLVLSTRILSDGNKEQQFSTDTLNDKDVLLGIQPGFYDVTARLVVRF